MGLVFEQICKDFLLRYADNLPSVLSGVGQWWGTDAKTRREIPKGGFADSLIETAECENVLLYTLDDIEIKDEYSEVGCVESNIYRQSFTERT